MFLAERDVRYADKVEAQLQTRVSILAQFPTLGRSVPGTPIRRLSLTDLQYVIDYEVADDHVLIARARSTRQNGNQP